MSSFAEEMEEIERRIRRRRLVRLAVVFVILGGALGLYAVIDSRTDGPPPDFDFRGVRLRTPPQSDMSPIEQDRNPEMVCYRRNREDTYVLMIPISDIHYCYDKKSKLLRIIKMEMTELELSMNAAEELDRAVSEKLGNHYESGNISANFLEEAKDLRFSKYAVVDPLGLGIRIEQLCTASPKEGTGIYEMMPTSPCDATLTFVDTDWNKVDVEKKPKLGL